MNKEACIQLHKLISSGDEQGAINLINSEKDIDVSYEHNMNIPVFSVISEKMPNLFKVIVNHPTFNNTVEDGFGETLFETLLYMYTAEESTKDNFDRVYLKELIDIVLKLDNYPFNAKDISEDTPLIISCEFTCLNWVTSELLKKKDIDINAINDVEHSALTEAIRYKNIEAIKMLSKMEGLVLRNIDIEEAQKANIDLSEYGITATATVSVTAE